MVHLVCLTKTHNENDFRIWYEWYKNLRIDQIHILDNESPVDIKKYIRPTDTYKKIEGWANQWKLFTDILNNNEYGFKDGDYVMFFDDDEFLWYDDSKPLETLLIEHFKMLECLLIPQILMSTKDFLKKRTKNLIESSTYRRNDLSNQGKAIIMYNQTSKYSFMKEQHNERGHVPFINGMRYSDVVGSGCSKTTYGLVDYNAPIRLYHYHIKSLEDWNIKIERGSAANKVQFYDKDITKNIFYGNYNVVDLTILNKAKNMGII